MAFCPWCAASVERSACPGCSRRVDAEWRVCPWCRTANATTPLVPSGVAPYGDGERRPRIIVCDDDRSVLEFVAAALVDVCDVLGAGTAEEAMRIAATEDVDAMVLDLGLPDLSGIEVTRLLRADTRTALLPIMLLTGSADPTLRSEAYHAGADLYLSKPVEPAALEANVRDLLERAPVED